MYMNYKPLLSGLFMIVASATVHGQSLPVGGAAENTPSHSEYFSWINNTNEGPTEEHTLTNLGFFKWLHDTYGMRLDIYAFDAGALDGAKRYGSTRSPRFRQQFPNGLGEICRKASQMGTQFGVWCGPDGFGDTQAEAEERMDVMTELVDKYHFKLFKMDAVCGQLRPEKYDYFDRMMKTIRQKDPGFILLNHRLNLGPGKKHSTTYLMGGEETYIDVFMTNRVTAPHHRARALSRKAPDGLTRLTEDHGVCLSSCLDYWEDDLILQAFNRELILAPQIYANPWLLRDDEFPYLAYIYNLHRDYRDILTNGIQLPAERYGEGAITRGDGKTQFITLRNMSWNKTSYRIRIDAETGLKDNGRKVKARLYHPYIYDMGSHEYGTEIEVEVMPFRVALVKLTNEEEKDKVTLSGIPYHIINDRAGNTAEVKLLGKPGERYKVRMERGGELFENALIDGGQARKLLKGQSVTLTFAGQRLKMSPYRKIADMPSCDVPADAEALYYATCFAADNNALEVRSLKRSGETAIPEVKAARDAFFGQKLFGEREIWDRNLFDGNKKTGFSIAMRWGDIRPFGESGFCLDMGESQQLDKLVIESFDEYSITPLKSYEGVTAFVSPDLKSWRTITFMAGPTMEIDLSSAGEVRFVRFSPCPIRLSEVSGYKNGKKVDSSRWRASNLFRPYGSSTCLAKKAWKSEITLDEIPDGATLCVAVNGYHGYEGAWAGLKIDGKYIGCPDRAPSFTSNTWEYRSAGSDRNYTYYVPLTKDMEGKKIEVYVLALNRNMDYSNTDRPDDGDKKGTIDGQSIRPQLWLNAYPMPFKEKTLKMQIKKKQALE